MRVHSLTPWDMAVGLRQRVGRGNDCLVLLELPARGPDRGGDPFSMTPEMAITLANKLRKMAKAAQA